MSGDAYANHIRHRDMVNARSEAGRIRAKQGRKSPAFQDEDDEE